MHTDSTLTTATRTVVVPALPTRVAGMGGDNAVKVYDTLLVVLGLIGATVSGWSIATLLHDEGGMQWGFAVLGVGIYDLLAFMAGLMVYIRRHEPHRAVGAQMLMVASIAGSAYVNYMHGLSIGGRLVALLLGAAPITFEVAFAMRHNVLSVITAVLFPRAMWRRYKGGVWVKLHTGSLPAASAALPEGVPPELPQATEVPAVLPAARKPLPIMRKLSPGARPEGLPEGWTREPRRSGSDTDVFTAPAGTPVPGHFRNPDPEAGSLFIPLPATVMDLPEVDSRKVTGADRKLMADIGLTEVEVPEASGSVPEGTEARAEAVAEALRKGDRMTGTTVGSMYGVSDSMGRTYIRRAKEINAARAARDGAS